VLSKIGVLLIFPSALGYYKLGCVWFPDAVPCYLYSIGPIAIWYWASCPLLVEHFAFFLTVVALLCSHGEEVSQVKCKKFLLTHNPLNTSSSVDRELSIFHLSSLFCWREFADAAVLSTRDGSGRN